MQGGLGSAACAVQRLLQLCSIEKIRVALAARGGDNRFVTGQACVVCTTSCMARVLDREREGKGQRETGKGKGGNHMLKWRGCFTTNDPIGRAKEGLQKDCLSRHMLAPTETGRFRRLGVRFCVG